MGREARERARVRAMRRDRLCSIYPIAGRMLSDPLTARQFIEVAALSRQMIGIGISPSPDFGLENFDAIIDLLKDALGIIFLSDAQFEYALRLAMPPECRDAGY